MKSKNLRKKSVAVLAGLAIAGAVGASAATLGGLGGEDLGADTGDVASCDTDGVDVGYTTEFDATAGEYLVTELNLSDINANCEGQDFDLTVLDGSDAVLDSFSGVIAQTGGAQDITVTTTGGLSAEAIEGLAMSISGATVTP